jgi:hypothetical protein
MKRNQNKETELSHINSYVASFMFFIISVLHPQNAYSERPANENTTYIIDKIAELQTAKVATVRLIPTDWMFVAEFGFELQTVGCLYVTNDLSRIDTLIDIIRQAHLKAANNTDYYWVKGPREGIYLTLSDGSEVKFVFEREYPSQNGVHGKLIQTNKFIDLNIVADKSIINSIIRWSVGIGAAPAKNVKDITACEYFKDVSSGVK